MTALSTAPKHELSTQPPLLPHTDLAAWTGTAIFAPHPDDESLGCGGLIRLLRDRDLDVHLIFVSDGAMSHPNSLRYDRKARISLRENEALAACRELGVGEDRVHFLRYPDTAVPRIHHAGFESAAARIGRLLQTLDLSHLVVPWRRDPHCDHRATWELCRAAYESLPPARLPRWVEYPIWMWNSDDLSDLPRPDEVVSWRLDVSSVLPTKLRAIDHHVSQLTSLIDDDPEGFQLQESMLANFKGDTELYFEDADKRSNSLDGNYFEGVYAKSTDPWSFESSDYERQKYEHSLSVLNKTTYDRAFEIGCSIGVLTGLLATRCRQLLCVDIAEKPLAIARERLAATPHVSFARMRLPDEFPTERFDLVVCSEVGYYWSATDLQKAIKKIKRAILPGGQLLLVHFTPYVPDYPLTGDEVHAAFSQQLGGSFHCVHADRAERYRLDLYQKSGGGASS